MVVRILVCAASKHRATGEIATRIAAELRAGLPGNAVVDVLPPAQVGDVTPFGAVVLGSAVYMGRWLEGDRHVAALLATHPPRPVWLFCSGPIGDPLKPDEEPVEVSDIAVATHARGHRLFAGRRTGTGSP